MHSYLYKDNILYFEKYNPARERNYTRNIFCRAFYKPLALVDEFSIFPYTDFI
jgi:hypothetical protein